MLLRRISRASTHKLLAVFTALAVAGLPATLLAATTNVGDYSALTNSIANGVDGDTIVLTNNITVSAEVVISAQGLTIEGNNYSISVPVPGLSDLGITNANPSAFRVFNISASGKTNTLQNLVIKGGATSSGGAGILNGNVSTLVLQRVTITQSSGGSSWAGGGLYNNNSAAVFMSDCNISRNAARYGGGFLNGAGCTMYLERCTFSENRSLSFNGGGGAGQNNGTFYANNCTFANNKSTELGGAFNNRPAAIADFVNCTFVGNIAYGTLQGGAIANNSGTVTLLNSLFAYNYRNNGGTYVLDDINNYYGTAPVAYYCVFQSTTNQLGASSLGTSLYPGNASGSDDSLFCGGAAAKVLGPDGTEVGSGTIYQPFLAKAGSLLTPTAVLQPGSFAFGKGVRTGFSSATASPVVGYYNGSSWVTLSGSSPASYEITTDQNGTSRGTALTVGAVNSTATSLFMLKVNASANGSVSGGTIYGDNYPSGTTVTLTAFPAAGYKFSEWDYVLGGSGVASTANPFAVTLTANVTLLPVFTVFTGFTISYSGNGFTDGSVPAQQVVDSGGSTNISGPDTMVKTGYAFSGWNTRSDGNGLNYAANDTYSGPTNLNLYAKWAINNPPVANADTAGTRQGKSINLSAAKLLANDTDAEGYTLTLTGVSAASTQGGTVSLNGGIITYAPAGGFEGADTFTYTVSDGRGATTIGTVTVTVQSSDAASLNIVYGPVVVGANFVIRFAGIPGYTYTIESTDSITPATWVKKQNLTAPAEPGSFGVGVFEFSESTGGATSRFFRTVWPAY